VLAKSSSLIESIVQYYGEVTEAEEPAVIDGEGEAPQEELEEDQEAEVEHGAEEEAVEETAAAEAAELEDEDLLEPPTAPVADFDLGEDRDEGVVVVEAVPAETEPEPVDEAEAAVVETVETMAEADLEAVSTQIDLDVLAVADAGKVAVLVADILEDAGGRGATRIHLLPYKNDFFLVYRVRGRLEKVASAPLSLQSALVEGFKNYARLTSVPSSLPALGRVRAEYGGRDLVLTVSAVPTISGQRVVITLSPHKPEPPSLETLGMGEAERLALQAMVERGRGLLLLCGPVASGRSATYYALLAHAAAVGKTVYSVERAIQYELPAVAQVMVNPGSPMGPASYIAAGLRQDTDVIAVDSVQTVEDVHLAVEAAGRGKLVCVTYTAGGVIDGVSRLLALGVEPNSLAAALTMAVGQRLVRTNCPECSEETTSELNRLVPDAEKDMVSRHGTGCPECRDSGYAGVTGVFEVLPFTEAIRSAIARTASHDAIEEAALGAGMRPLVRSGLSKVKEGLVSVEELDRVLRFSG
jgi:general secretion pathway protein E